MAKPDAPALSYGQRVEIEAKVRLPHNYQNPGAFDYAAYLSRQNIFWYASIPRDGAVHLAATAAHVPLPPGNASERHASAEPYSVLICSGGRLAAIARACSTSFRRPASA